MQKRGKTERKKNKLREEALSRQQERKEREKKLQVGKEKEREKHKSASKRSIKNRYSLAKNEFLRRATHLWWLEAKHTKDIEVHCLAHDERQNSPRRTHKRSSHNQQLV
jgi:hypothetical protein